MNPREKGQMNKGNSTEDNSCALCTRSLVWCAYQEAGCVAPTRRLAVMLLPGGWL
jgi:hypothetical protein